MLSLYLCPFLCLGMLQVMGGLERQIQEYATREDTTNKQAIAAREKIQEALTIREQANAKVAQYDQEIARLQAERKQLLVTRQVRGSILYIYQ